MTCSLHSLAILSWCSLSVQLSSQVYKKGDMLNFTASGTMATSDNLTQTSQTCNANEPSKENPSVYASRAAAQCKCADYEASVYCQMQVLLPRAKATDATSSLPCKILKPNKWEGEWLMPDRQMQSQGRRVGAVSYVGWEMSTQWIINAPSGRNLYKLWRTETVSALSLVVGARISM